MGKLRIAIIGAGPCGLSQLLAFKRAEQDQQVELVCFERQSDWGGLWILYISNGSRCSWRTHSFKHVSTVSVFDHFCHLYIVSGLIHRKK